MVKRISKSDIPFGAVPIGTEIIVDLDNIESYLPPGADGNIAYVVISESEEDVGVAEGEKALVQFYSLPSD
ncbi:MAG: hypothetical protein J7K26_04245 [Candidatus Aenigmarchaeota archaeon]|nr:hypothetical protein [Candidatus Aenigmarchaeota archaeon]